MGFFKKLFGLGKKKTEEQVQAPALENKLPSVEKAHEPQENKGNETPVREEHVVEVQNTVEVAHKEQKPQEQEQKIEAHEPVQEVAPKAEETVAPVEEKIVEPAPVETPVVETKAEPAVEPAPVEAPAAEVKAEPVVEAAPVEAPAAEVKAEEPVVEATPVEAPAAEVKVEPVVEAAPVEAPAAEVKAEPVVEAAPVEAPVVEVKAEPVVEAAPVEAPAAEVKAEEPAPAEKPKRTRKTAAKKAETTAEGEEAPKPKRTRKTAAKKTETAEGEATQEEKPKRTRKTAAKKTEATAEGEEAPKPKRTRKTAVKKTEAEATEAVAEAKPKRTRKPAAKKTEAVADDSAEGVSSTQESRSEEKASSQENNSSQEASSQESQPASSEREPERVEAEPVAETAVEVVPAETKSSFFSRLKSTRDRFASGFSALIKGRKIDEDLYEELETDLLTADLGIHTTNYIIERLRKESTLRDLHDASALRENLNKMLCEILEPSQQKLDVTAIDKKPFVILMVGVNGAGKTTTIGKLAQKYKSRGLKVMLAAGDTFRAAAVEQLKEWGERTEVPVIAQATGSDAASVIYDSVNAAKARNVDVLICDTAGRLQNKSQLMDELEKIVRVMKKIDPSYPNETLLVLDAATGQNAVSQTQIFTDKVNVTGLALTKLDGTARGGIVFSLSEIFRLPIRFIGLGEKAEDLRDFEIKAFVDSVLREDD